MTPQEREQFAEMVQKVNQLNDLYFRTHFIDREVFENPVYLNGQVYFKHPNFLKDTTLPTGTTTGATIGDTGDKIGFLGATPVLRQAAVTTPSGGGTGSTDAIDISARTAIGEIKTALQNLGLTS